MIETEDIEDSEKCPDCGAEVEEYPNGKGCTNPNCSYKYIYNF